MNSFPVAFAVILFFLAAWFAWHYYDLRRIDRYTNEIRRQDGNLPTDIKGIENLSNAVAALKSTFNLQLSNLNAETARLSTVLEQLTDGVLIADANGLIQFANPAAQKLFEIPDVIGRSITEVVRNHQLVDAWRRCQQTREMQSRSVELPARRQFLQLIAIPDTHADGSLLLAQDLTRVRRL